MTTLRPRLALPPPAAHGLTETYARLLAREGAAGVAQRLSDVRAAVAADHALRSRTTAPPSAEDYAARRFARRPMPARGAL